MLEIKNIFDIYEIKYIDKNLSWGAKISDYKDCLDFKGPVLQDFKDKKYKFNGKCYKYSTTSVSCDENKNTIKVN